MTDLDRNDDSRASRASRVVDASTTSERVPEPRPAGIRRSTSYSPELESLRGWAMLLVFVFHAEMTFSGLDRTGTMVPLWLSYVTAGHTGVTLFFVLSAFLLSRPFLEAGQRGRTVRSVDFFRRRVLRIMPLYTVAVVLAVVLSGEYPGKLKDGFRALFFVNSFVGGAVRPEGLWPYSAVWWSLGTEVQFYLVLPLLGLCLRSTKTRMAGWSVLIGWAVLYGIVTSNRAFMLSDDGLRFGLGLPGRAPAFLAGIAAAWMVSRHGERLRRAFRESGWLGRGGSDLLLLCLLVALGLLLRNVTFLGFIPAEQGWPIWHLAESALWGLVLLLVVLAPLRAHALVSNRVVASFGLISYSLYLVHMPILFSVMLFLRAHGGPMPGEPLTRIATIVGTFAICVVLSALSYRFIERPFLLRKARIDD